MIVNLLLLVISYLVGSIPFGYVIIRLAQGKDIREEGSGNIGATNVMRTGKKWQGALTFILDAGKGYLCVMVARWILRPESSAQWTWITAVAFMVVLGHIFSIFLRFKGGKGVATGCGAYLAITPIAVLTTLVAFVLVILISRYVSLASILATGFFPLWAWLYGYGNEGMMVVIYGSIFGAALIILRHHENIRRLVNGTERKIGQKPATGPA